MRTGLKRVNEERVKKDAVCQNCSEIRASDFRKKEMVQTKKEAES